MTTRTKILIGAIIVLLIISGIVLFIGNRDIDKNKNTGNNILQNETQDIFNQYINSNETNDTSKNEVKENATNKTENVIEESSIIHGDEAIEKENSYTLVEKEKNSDKVPVTGTDEQRAIALAKNKWGVSDNTVNFNIANHDGKIYYVSVNNSETSAVITWYKINVETEEVSDY